MISPTAQQVASFHRVLGSWIPVISGIDVRYVALYSNNAWTLYNASVTLSPQAYQNEYKEEIRTDHLRVGHIQRNLDSKQITALFEKSLLGELSLGNIEYSFPKHARLDYYSVIPRTEPQHFDYRLRILGSTNTPPDDTININRINADLRCLATPFDGIQDLFSFFGFSNLAQLPHNHEIELILYPPVALVLQGCVLSKDRITIQLQKHLAFSHDEVYLGIRQFPNPTLDRRRQIGKEIIWKSNGSVDEGTVEMSFDNVSAVELLLSASGNSVTRYFLIDKDRSLNYRLKNYLKYDRELKALRDALYSGSKESRFLESGIATLAYLMGFATLNPPLTDAPDIIVETKQGRVAVVECTTKTSDIRAKASKLVDRRFVLTSEQNGGNATTDGAIAVLIVNLPRDQIVDEAEFLIQNEVLLVTKEDIDYALTQIEIPPETDSVFEKASIQLRDQRSKQKGFPF